MKIIIYEGRNTNHTLFCTPKDEAKLKKIYFEKEGLDSENYERFVQDGPFAINSALTVDY